MTHSLHRQGDHSSLSRDFVVFAISAQGVNSTGSASKFRQFAAIVQKYHPVNLGDMRTGNMLALDVATIAENTQDNSIFHAVFTDPEVVGQVLAELRAADLGLSIVVSGLFDAVNQCCRAAGLSEHTVEHSLGILGRTERLPAREVQEISTMCGHGMVAFSLIEHLAGEVARGAVTMESACKTLARQCHCGIFNPVRAAELLTTYIAGNETKSQTARGGSRI
jgi:hypothetical protein